MGDTDCGSCSDFCENKLRKEEIIMFEKLMAQLAMMSAQMGAGTASLWNLYQPKQPKNMKK